MNSNAVPFDPAQLPSVFEIDIDGRRAAAAAQAEPAAAQPAAKPVKSEGFAGLGVSRALVRALHQEGITEPFEIQTATLPDAIAGRDVLGRGQTGSGKTLAFGLALLSRLSEGKPARPHHPRALILVPTRELAMQVADALRPLAKAAGLYLGTAVGGVPYDRQILGLQKGLDLMIATPGRLGDLIERGSCSLEEIEISVLDEADQMADMGFLPDVTELLQQTPPGGQRLLFSATLDGDVDQLVRKFMNDPVTHSTAPAQASVSTMDHMLLLIPPQEKFKIMAAIANRKGRTIMFARTQMAVDRMVEQLREVGVRAGGLHGGKTQRVRTRTLAEFKEGRTGVLVATDVAARGIHVDGVSLVVHIDPPKDPKDYLHRAGRTARAGESGAVATLVLPKQRRMTLQMMQKAGVDAPAEHRLRVTDQALVDLTGAQEPSGVPVKEEPLPFKGRGGRSFGDRDRGGDRGDRPRRSFGDRDRSFGDRGGDRPQRSFAQGDRPRYNSDRPSFNSDRPSFGSDRPRREGSDRPSFSTDRPRRDSADRPGFASDRPKREGADRPSFGTDRPRRESSDRPARKFNRD